MSENNEDNQENKDLEPVNFLKLFFWAFIVFIGLMIFLYFNPNYEFHSHHFHFHFLRYRR